MGWLKTFIKEMLNDKSSNYENSKSVSIEIKPVITLKDDPVPLETLLKDAFPSKQGLYPHEIVMLEYAPKYKTSENKFQKFWYWSYSVTDPQSILNSLAERGFIEPTNIQVTLEKLTLSQLKEELKEIGQKVTGKKSELVARIMDYADLQILEEKYPERYFALTPKGEQELQENQYISYLVQKNYMSIWEMNKLLAHSKFSYRDILWQNFNNEYTLHFQNYDFGYCRNTRFDMYQFLIDENRYEAALQLLCEVVAYDLSGLGNNAKSTFEWEKENPLDFYLNYYPMILKRYFPYGKNNINIPPAIIKEYSKIQSNLGYDSDEYKKIILKNFESIHLLRNIFTPNELTEIVVFQIQGSTCELEKIYKTAETREKNRIKEIIEKNK